MDVKYIGSGIGVVIGWLLFLYIIFSYFFLQVREPTNKDSAILYRQPQYSKLWLMQANKGNRKF